MREHDMVPSNPKDGERFTCWCGDAWTFVVLDDGLPGEWVAADARTADPDRDGEARA